MRIFKFLNNIFVIVVAVIYGGFLAKLPSFFFKDRENYINNYILNNDLRLEDITASPLLFLFNEPFFLYFIRLVNFLKDPILIISFVVFVINLLLTFIVFKICKNSVKSIILLILLFFNIQFFALQLVTLRQGLGTMLFLFIIFYVKKEKLMLVLIALLGLFHNSFYIVVAFLSFYYVLDKRTSLKFNSKILLVFIAAVFFNLFVLALSNLLGTKQDYSNIKNVVSGLMFIVWFLLFIYLMYVKNDYTNNKHYQSFYIISLIGLIIYLTSYFISPVGGRLIGTFIPFIYLCLLYKPNLRDIVVSFTFFGLQFYVFLSGGVETFLWVDFNRILEYIYY